MTWDHDKMAKLKDLLIPAISGLAYTDVPYYIYSYSAEDEVMCLRAFDTMAKELRYLNYSVELIYLSQMLLTALHNLDYLDDAILGDEAMNLADIEDNLQNELPQELVVMLKASLAGDYTHCAILLRVGSLFPFVHPYQLLSLMEGTIRCTIVLPFPGSRDGTILNYRRDAGRIFPHGVWL